MPHKFTFIQSFIKLECTKKIYIRPIIMPLSARAFVRLQVALAYAAEANQEVLILPPDGSDAEDIGKDTVAPDPPQEVSGLQEILEGWLWICSVDKIQCSSLHSLWGSSSASLNWKSPASMFLLYFTPEMAGNICEICLTVRRLHFHLDNQWVIEVRCFSSMDWLCYLSRWRLYWDSNFDCRMESPYKLFHRERFQKIKKFLHFSNSEASGAPSMSKFAKIKYLFEAINKNLEHFGIPEQNLFIDEQMVSYIDWHPQKNFMKAKPVLWGFKNYLLSTSSGYPLHVIPYQGKQLGNNTPLTKKWSNINFFKDCSITRHCTRFFLLFQFVTIVPIMGTFNLSS